MLPSELLSDPAKWCQGYYAFDAYGEHTSPEGDEACRWCLVGAVRRCVPRPLEQNRILTALHKQLGCFVHEWNDSPTTTHADVLAVLKECDL